MGRAIKSLWKFRVLRVSVRFVLPLLLAYFGTVEILTEGREAAAAPLGTGTGTIDTVISADGSTTMALNAATGSVWVIDNSTNGVTGVVSALGAGTGTDIDWHESIQSATVTSSFGDLLTVDPLLLTSTAVVTGTGATNFSHHVADNYQAGNAVIVHDQVAGWINSVDLLGNVTAVAAVNLGPIVEMSGLDPGNLASPLPGAGIWAAVGQGYWPNCQEFAYSAQDLMGGTYIGNICKGKPGGPPTADEPVGMQVMPATGNAMVQLASASGVGGDLLEVDLMNPGAPSVLIHQFSAGAIKDVSAAGDFVGVLATDGAGNPVRIHIFDVGDSANPIFAGTYEPSSMTDAIGGFAMWMDEASSSNPGGTGDDIHLSFADGSSGSTGMASRDYAGDFQDQGAYSIVPGTNLAFQNVPLVKDMEPFGCSGGCDPDKDAGTTEDSGTQAPATTPSNVQFFTGEEVFTLPLFSVPGVGPEADFRLTYRSRKTHDYRYGNGWSFNQDRRLRVEVNGDRSYFNGSGRMDVYTSLMGGGFVAPTRYDTNMVVAGATTTVTNRFGLQTTFTGNYRTSLQDRYGNLLTYVWTGDQLTSISDTLGRTFTLNYDVTGRLSSIVDYGGRTWAFTYDYLGQLKTVTYPASTSFPLGRTVRFAYSANSATAAFRSNLTHVYSAKGDLVQSFAYDVNDMVSQERVGPGTYDISYDIPNRKTTIVDRSGSTEEITFDTIGLMSKREEFTKGLRAGEPASFITTYTATASGRVASVVRPNGNRVEMTYDGVGNVTQVRRKETNTPLPGANDLVTSFTYEPVHSQLVQAVDPKGNVTTYTVDAFGNTTQIQRPTITSPASQTITEIFTYDSRGRILSATDGEGRVTNFTYHTTGIQNGYLAAVIRDPSGLALTTGFQYDQYGNVITITDPRGNATSMSVDAENFVMEVTAPTPLNYRTRISYDANRNVSLVEVENIDKDGTVDSTTPWIPTSFSYNDVDWLVSKTVQLTASSTAVHGYSYQDAGLLEQYTDPEGNVTEYAYDERDLLFEATRGWGTAEASTIRFDYDPNGNLLVLTNGRGYATTNAFDGFDRVTRVTNALGHYTAYTYDKNGNVTALNAYDVSASLMAGRVNRYDEMNRLWQIELDRFGPGLTASSPQTTFTRDRGHLLTKIVDPLLAATTYTYDAAGRRTVAKDPAGNEIRTTYDAAGNVTQVDSVELPTTGTAETFTTKFAYDELNRVTERREVDRITPTHELLTEYFYDSRGNLTFQDRCRGQPEALDLRPREPPHGGGACPDDRRHDR